jgi:hypothetical protein
MSERDRRWFFDEHFPTLALAQEALERRGYFFHPVPREHTEGLVTSPVLHRLRTQIKKRGFERVAGHVAITFSGFSRDEREIFAIPAVRAYWRQLDRELPELPALLAVLPELTFNGPSQHLLLLGTIDAVIDRPAAAGFTAHVADAEPIIAAAVRRIREAGRRHHLSQTATANLVVQFERGARYRHGPA